MLRDMRVQLIHEVPPQHKIEKNAGSHALTKQEKKQFQEFAKLKQGFFTADEDTIICKNWKKFCKIHNWDKRNQKPFLYMRHGAIQILRFLEERRKFVQFLAMGLPNRTLYSVHQRFRKLYQGNLHGRFKEEEDILILEHIENNPNVNPRHMHADLAKILNRPRDAIWRRYQVLQKCKKKAEED
ncbi:uncharacterized protein LOC117176204 isoform X2 [Belonocnema kinseyi]|nr:uncharacterized protein LOC117176204 isoform X2 [Belonocnema kinseyi]XP_033222218.1 uncharacterized protein LOC117176204 isoform X2 [Belonocnema kinseyi]